MKTAFCFDLDGTVTRQEILPLISREVNLWEEIKLLTQLTLKGDIPFETSFKLRVKLLQTVPISTVAKIVQNVMLNETIVKFIKANNENCYIVTGNLDVWVGTFIESELGCRYYSSKAEYTGNNLQGISAVLNKGEAITEISKDYDRVVSIGDSMNDCPMFEKANIRIAFGGVHQPVENLITISDFIVYHEKSLITILEHYNEG